LHGDGVRVRPEGDSAGRTTKPRSGRYPGRGVPPRRAV